MNKVLIEEISNLKDKIVKIGIDSSTLRSDYSNIQAMLNTCFNCINHKLDCLFDLLEVLNENLARKEKDEKSKRLKDEIRHRQDELNYLSNAEIPYRAREERYNFFHSKDYNRKE